MSRYIYIENNDLQDSELKEFIQDEFSISLSDYLISEVTNEVFLNENTKFAKDVYEKLYKIIKEKKKETREDISIFIKLLKLAKFDSIKEKVLITEIKEFEAEVMKEFSKLDYIDDVSLLNTINIESLKELNQKITDSYFWSETYSSKLKERIRFIQEAFINYDNNFEEKDFIQETFDSDLEDYTNLTKLNLLFKIAKTLDLKISRDY